MRKKQEGFTIIEVVLVLAIAGLIFLIVFLALPALQRSRRDTQRRNDAGRFLAAAQTYAGNNEGDPPPLSPADPEYTEFVDDYLNGEFVDPEGGEYENVIFSVFFGGNFNDLEPGTFVYAANYECQEGGAVGGQLAAAPGKQAVVMGLEDGNYCQDTG